MSILTLALGYAIASNPSGQIDPNELTFQKVLSQLSSSTSLFVQITGSTTYRGKSTPITSSLSWSTNNDGTKQVIQVELQEFVNNILVKRIVGDGDTLWIYNLPAHEYSAMSYGGSGKVRPDGYQLHLLDDLSWATTGQSAYLAKFLKQTFNNGGTYSSWMPGIDSQGLPQGATSYDPINSNITYIPNPTDNFYLYDGSPKRSIVFEIVTQAQPNGLLPIDVLQNIYLNQVDQVGRYQKYTHWQLTPYSNVTFTPDIFKPYSGSQTQGWRAVVGPKPTSN